MNYFFHGLWGWADDFGEGAVTSLRARLKDEDAFVQWNVAIALGDLAPLAKDAIPDLKEVLQNGDKYLRLFAAHALVEIAGPDAKEAVPILVEELRQRDEYSRTSAIGNCQDSCRLCVILRCAFQSLHHGLSLERKLLQDVLRTLSIGTLQPVNTHKLNRLHGLPDVMASLIKPISMWSGLQPFGR